MTRKQKTPPDDEREVGEGDEGSEKKERVIHTRVPERLENELRERAQGLGISVSNLVRNVLGHAFGLVGDIMADGASVARAARGERVGVAAKEPAVVLAWQPIVMAMNAVCVRCNDVIPRGTDAALGIVDDAAARPVVCPPCLEEIRHGDDSDDDDRSTPRRGR